MTHDSGILTITINDLNALIVALVVLLIYLIINVWVFFNKVDLVKEDDGSIFYRFIKMFLVILIPTMIVLPIVNFSKINVFINYFALLLVHLRWNGLRFAFPGIFNFFKTHWGIKL